MTSGVATYKIERRRQDFERKQERDRETTITLGAARLLDTYLDNVRHIALSLLTYKSWWHEEIDVVLEMPYDDQRRIASSATSEEWAKIDVAFHAIQTLRAMRSLAARTDEPDDAAKEPVVQRLAESTHDEILDAQRVLTRLSGSKVSPVARPWKERVVTEGEPRLESDTKNGSDAPGSK